MIEVYLAVLAAIVPVVDLILIVIWLVTHSNRDQTSDVIDFPMVTVLIAARNEEANISRCLQSLLKQDYPADKLEIIVGDDGSTDRTYKIAKSILSGRTNSSIIQIEKPIVHLKGKANVLAQLATEAKGQYLFITDADTDLPSSWITNMLSIVTDNVGIVTGITAVHGNHWQNLDWTFALAMVKALHNLGKPVTTMGNNMMVTKEAYLAIGGYESIPFSITEDLEIFKQVKKKGYDVVQLYKPEVLAYTQPIKSFFQLMQQRKRWMKGAVQLPLPVVTLLFIQAAYLPLLIVLTFIDFESAAYIFIAKIFLQSVFIILGLKATKQKIPWLHLIFYEFYSWLVTLSSSIFYLVPIKVSWKGRKY
jgi:cellulose synthase/poly-beta-1,6-N-acetylglucosamine synthase-like glycosyltransferase